MANDIFRVTILNWEKHNRHNKRTHKYTMISNNIFSDSKFQSLSASLRCLFLYTLTRCGDDACATVTLHERNINMALASRLGATNALLALEQLQLVTFEKISSLIERKNRKNRKNSTDVKKSVQSPEATSVPGEPVPDPPPKVPQTPVRIQTVEQFENLIPQNVWDTWHQHFDEDFVRAEMGKALLWAMNNPVKGRKTPLGWSRMMTRWLQESWDKHVAKKPGEKQNKIPEYRI